MSKTITTNDFHEEMRPAKSAEVPKRQNNTAKARYIELAKKYLKEHPKRGKYYAVNYRFDMGSDLDVGVYIDFTDEEIKCIDHILDDLIAEYHLTDFLQNPQGITQDRNFDRHTRRLLRACPKSWPISGGQAQRLALARTLYHKRPVIVLDDPFSALDRHTEEEVFENLRRECSDSVVFLISHRLYKFPETDLIIWMDDGKTICGTHEELMQSVPQYRELYNMQKDGEENEKE